MTFKELKEILIINRISEDVKLMSNSGWECGATEMSGIWFNKENNEIHFTQGGETSYKRGWIRLK